MKQYSHDYTLVQHADNLLQEALVKIKWDNFWDARIRIEDARKKLQQYLSQDNMVEDDDVADGWVRASEAKNELEDFQRWVYETPRFTVNTPIPERFIMVNGKQDISEKPSPKVVRHGQIDRQYRQQLDGVGDPDCPLYGKVVRITGTFDQIAMSRDEVAAACQRMGAKSASEGFVKSMDVFIMGNDAGPSKLKKVQELRAEGRDVRILSLIEFKEILDKYDTQAHRQP